MYGKENKAYKKDTYLFPIQVDAKLAVLHLPALSAVLTVFAQEHEFMLVSRLKGPFRGEHQRC